MELEDKLKDDSTQDNTDADDTGNAADVKDDAKDDTSTDDKGGLPGDDKKDGNDKGDDKSGLPGGDDKADDKADKGDDDKKGDDEPKGAPEKYETFDISAGEDIGYTMNESQFEEFSKVAKGLNLTQEQANDLVQYDIARQKEIAASQDKQLAEKKADWIKETRKEHGDKYDAKYQKNALVYTKLFDENTRTVLNDTGISSMPGFFKALEFVSEKLSEDSFVGGDRVSTTDLSKRSLEDAMKDKK